MLPPFLFKVFFAALIRAVLVHFSAGPKVLRHLVHLEEDLGEDGVKVDTLACIRRAIWGMLYADDASNVFKSAEGFAKMLNVIVTVFEAAGLTVSERKPEAMLLRISNQAPQTPPLVSEAVSTEV